MIPDDLYWVPDGIKVSGNIDDIIPQTNPISLQQQYEFNLSIKWEPLNVEDEQSKYIEDEILEMLGITEEDLLLEAALQTQDHKKYIEELIQEALSEQKEQPYLYQQQQSIAKEQQEIQETNSSFKTLYERQYLSFADTQLNNQDEIIYKTSSIEQLIGILDTECQAQEDQEDKGDIINLIKKKAHSKVIHRFCQLRNQPVKKLVFNYIELVEKQDDIKDILVDKLKELSLIDSAKTEQLLDQFNEYQLKTILEKQIIPVVRFKILSTIKKDDKLMIEFFELLCQLHPNQVIAELQKGGYPQDECLKLCRYYGNLKGLAYLLERSGSVLEAINLQFDLFIQSLKQQLQRNPILIEGPPELVTIIEAYLKPTLDICRLNTKRNDDESDNNWFQVQIRLTKLRQEFYKINFKNVLRCFNQVHTNLLSEILEKTKIKGVLDNMNETMKYFEFQELKSTFQQLLSGQQYELAIQGEATMLIKLTANKYLSNLYQVYQFGTSVDNYCYQCQSHIDVMAKVFVECNHTFHLECSQEQLCKICVQQFSTLLRKLLVIFTNRRSTRLLVPNTTITQSIEQVKQSQINKRQEKIRKLKEFDIQKTILYIK